MTTVSTIHEPELCSLTYISHCTIPDDSLVAELSSIQKVASERNAKNEVSGKLIYRRGFFLQRLEGKQALLKGIYDSIKQDSRHRRIKTLYFDKIPRRLFVDWSQMQVITKGQFFSELDSFLERSSLMEELSINDKQSMFLLKFMEQFKEIEA